MKRLISGAYALIAFLFAVASPRYALADPALTPLRIVVIPTEIAALPYYADDLGFFRDAGLSVQITSLANGAAATAAVVSGAMDVGFSNTFSLVIAHDKGLPLVVVSSTDLHLATDPVQGFLAVTKSSPLKAAADFNGKTVGVPGLGNTTYYALRKWIDKNGGNSSSVKYVELALPTIGDAVSANRIDAGSLDSANMFDLRGRAKLREVASTYDSIAKKFMAGAWFTTPTWLAANPDVAKRFVAALDRASAWANSHHAEAVRIYAKHSAFSVADLESGPRPTFDRSTAAPDLLQPVIDLAAQYGAIKQRFDAAEIIGAEKAH
jgi:NitT/TauT family transport system substrate-binding protein